jgi:hypothetical protein
MALVKTGGRMDLSIAFVKEDSVLVLRVMMFLPPQQWLRQA